MLNLRKNTIYCGLDPSRPKDNGYQNKSQALYLISVCFQKRNIKCSKKTLDLAKKIRPIRVSKQTNVHTFMTGVSLHYRQHQFCLKKDATLGQTKLLF